MIRLDKFLAQSGERTRSEATRLIRQGTVKLNGQVERDPARKLDPKQDAVSLGDEAALPDRRFQYYLLHKPAGVLTAARDNRASTVMELVPEALLCRKVLPVGRLDKDTTGILFLTNDGELAHRLLSPKRHVVKEYHALVEGMLSPGDVEAFAGGMALSDFVAQPAEMRIVEASQGGSRAVLFLKEGKFHQVKRMFAARGHPVISLHRTAFGPLRLPEDLPPGGYRELSPEEVEALRRAVK